MPGRIEPKALFRPKVFIGSSSTKEAKDVANYIRDDFRENGIDALVWNHDIFQIGQHTLTELTRILQHYDFGVMVFWPDDELTLRGTSYKATRDNVVFELGMFIGALGPDRAFILRNQMTTRWLSDLAGLGVAEFVPDENLKGAASSAIAEIREAILKRTPACITAYDFSSIEEAHDYISLILQEGSIRTVRQASLSRFPYQGAKPIDRFKQDITVFLTRDGNSYRYVYNPDVQSRTDRVKHLLGCSRMSALSARELSGNFPDDTCNFILFDAREAIVVLPAGELPSNMRLYRHPDIIRSFEVQFRVLFACGKQPSYWPVAV
jgi:hypothetical protein